MRFLSFFPRKKRKEALQQAQCKRHQREAVFLRIVRHCSVSNARDASAAKKKAASLPLHVHLGIVLPQFDNRIFLILRGLPLSLDKMPSGIDTPPHERRQGDNLSERPSRWNPLSLSVRTDMCDAVLHRMTTCWTSARASFSLGRAPRVHSRPNLRN